jgi:nucleotide-binding universal stress UspA family protein
VVFGSVSEAVIRQTRVPVLAVHERRTPLQSKRILAPFNMEAYADETLLYILDAAEGLEADVTVLYVTDFESRPGMARKHLLQHLSKLLGPRRAGALEARVRHGDPRVEIIAEAKRGKFDLIALSAHRRPFFSDYVLGSTAERLIRHSPIAVLSVPSVGSREQVHSYVEWGS